MSLLDREEYSDETEIAQFKRVADNVFGLTFDDSHDWISGFNMLGIRSKHVIFSRRIDSRTYFIQDDRHGLSRVSGVFKGDDKDQFEVCRAILQRLDIPLSEIAEEVVLREKTQVAQIDQETKSAKVEPVQEGGNFVSISRQIKGLPVWSSSFLLGLTKQRQIGFMQLHWPMVPIHVEFEAQRLRYKVERGWRAPDWTGAVVETVEAGVVHTPAAGFFLSVHPAIRVIYAPRDGKTGRKVTLYLDRHGKAVPLRPQSVSEVKPPQQRRSRSFGLKSSG